MLSTNGQAIDGIRAKLVPDGAAWDSPSEHVIRSQ